MDRRRPTPEVLYAHRQTGGAMRALAFLPAACIAVVVWLTPGGNARLPAPLLVAIATAMTVLLYDSATLTVTLMRDRLLVRFGVGLLHRTVPLAAIAGVEVVRTTWRDGWGIHWSKGTVHWNVTGHAAVRLDLVDGRRLVLGSDEAERLAAAIGRGIGRVPDRPVAPAALPTRD